MNHVANLPPSRSDLFFSLQEAHNKSETPGPGDSNPEAAPTSLYKRGDAGGISMPAGRWLQKRSIYPHMIATHLKKNCDGGVGVSD